VAGFKYFDFRDVGRISLGLSGRGVGVVEISTDPEFRTLAGWIPVTLQESARTFFGNIQIPNGVQPLYFRYRGSGAINFHWLQLE